jgi:hypothetical protein
MRFDGTSPLQRAQRALFPFVVELLVYLFFTSVTTTTCTSVDLLQSCPMRHNPAMLRKTAIAALVIGALILLRAGFLFITAPDSRKIVADTIDPSVEPLQIPLEDFTPIEIAFEDGSATLIPQAKYTIAAKLCGRKRYRRPWQSLVAPYDLCLSWGRLATEELSGKVKFSQDMRWYQFLVKPGTSFDPKYVSAHSANTHLIYADKNLEKAAARLSKGDIVELTGYLINLKGKYKGYEVWWNSSMTREDTGNGACEVLYLTGLRKGNMLYQATQK